MLEDLKLNQMAVFGASGVIFQGISRDDVMTVCQKDITECEM